jgi:hypothetical protein
VIAPYNFDPFGDFANPDLIISNTYTENIKAAITNYSTTLLKNRYLPVPNNG